MHAAEQRDVVETGDARTDMSEATTRLVASPGQLLAGVLGLVTAVIGVETSDAGIMLAERDGALHYVASTSNLMRVLELVELQYDEGPCLDAYRTGLPAHADTTDGAITCWPRFASHARDFGFRSMGALPLRLRTEVIGALDVFSTAPEPVSPQDLQLAQAVADIATIAILQERALHDARVATSQLEGALQSRVVIEQAKGIVAEHNHVSVDDAFELLRGYARHHNRLLRKTADDIIGGSLASDALTEPTRSRRTERDSHLPKGPARALRR